MDGKSILITGAGSGIGRAAALAFSQQGVRIVAVDLRADAAEETAQLVIAGGGEAYGLGCDVASFDAVNAMFARTTAFWGKIDFAFNNAGIAQKFGNVADIEPDEWHRIMRVNVDGVWHCMRHELRHMTEQGGGVIVNTSSFAGLRTLRGQGAYVASKHAVVGLTQNAAVEYASAGIRVNAICPGGVQTPLLASALAGLKKEEAQEALRQSAALHPMGRLGEADEMAQAALFLCSEQASFITGVCLPVDGGWAAN